MIFHEAIESFLLSDCGDSVLTKLDRFFYIFSIVTLRRRKIKNGNI